MFHPRRVPIFRVDLSMPFPRDVPTRNQRASVRGWFRTVGHPQGRSNAQHPRPAAAREKNFPSHDRADRLQVRRGRPRHLRGDDVPSAAAVAADVHARVLDWPGGFAGLFRLDDGIRLLTRKYRDPVLVASTDGVGTKLKLAFATGRHHTVGIDLVAMSVNDCLCAGAEPLLFLDYVAMSRDDPDLTTQIVQGISDGCVEAECALLGGETAILPDFYKPGEYDLAGFCLGVVERRHILDGQEIRAGDQVIGLASSGLHSNGYSLARKLAFEVAGLQPGLRRARTGP